MSGQHDVQVRFARQTADLERATDFYTRRLGLPVLGGFRDHADYSGTFIDLPGTGAHLELTATPHLALPAPHPETLLVLYLGSTERVARMQAKGDLISVAPTNPYWATRGITVEDPDGWRIVLCSGTGK